MANLENLKYLKDDMVNKNWSICDFIFVYKRIEYIVLVKRFVGAEKRRNKYALLKLHFMDSRNIHNDLEVEANSNGLIITPQTLREYFEINYSDNLGDILKQFSEELGRAIPKEMKDIRTINELEKDALIYSLSKSDSEDPDKIYCIGIKRNPKGYTRTEFNSDKTKILRENLYNMLSNDRSISFCYSSDLNKEKNDTEILINFKNN